MEFLIINRNKLKISLSAEEVLEYSLTDSEDGVDAPEMRKSFWRILDIAKDGCGFSANGERMLIQYYPTGTGGEIFVTKLGRLGAATERTLGTSSNITMLSSRRTLCKLSDATALICAAKSLCREAVHTAELYYGEDGEYYLAVEERVSKGAGEISRLSEFGRELPYSLMPYIKEHSYKINSPDILSDLVSL